MPGLILRKNGKPRSPGAKSMKRAVVNTEKLASRVKPETFDRAAKMLKAPTPAEKAMAHRFKHSKLKNWPVKQQFVVLGYILDFYFPTVGVCVEVDGSHHWESSEQAAWDKARGEALARYGIDTIRISNHDAIHKTARSVAAVRDFIFEKAQRLLGSR